jgi:hypothetical protein
MLLKNLNEFRPKTQPNDSNTDLAHGGSLLFLFDGSDVAFVTDVTS